MPKFFNYLRQDDFPPSGFENSLRFIGTDYQHNYFFANERKNYSVSLNSNFSKNQKDTYFAELTLNSSIITNPSDQKNYSLNLSLPQIKFNPSDAQNLLSKISAAVAPQPQETGNFFVGLSSSIFGPPEAKESGECSVSLQDLKISGVFRESGENGVSLESFIKAANKLYNNIDIILYTGVYGEPIRPEENYNLDIIFYTGSYQGPIPT